MQPPRRSAPLTFQVEFEQAAETEIVINEVMAKNANTLVDSTGEFDDWIELVHLGTQAVDLSGTYLSDKEANPLKWVIPDRTMNDANGYGIIWADDVTEQEALHASFKLSSGGEPSRCSALMRMGTSCSTRSPLVNSMKTFPMASLRMERPSNSRPPETNN